MSFKRVLITGTTSGLGRAFLKHYCEHGAEVIGLNRRAMPNTESQPANSSFSELHITNYDQVLGYLKELDRGGNRPDLMILNAGINVVDNIPGDFDFKTYQEVMDINLKGVMTFVGALSKLGWSGVTIVGMSSTSNIIPNPGHLGYHLSKWNIRRAFDLLQTQDSKNTYKTVVLGPVHTNIMAQSPALSGLNKKIFDFLAVDADTAARRCARFFEGRGRNLNYTCLSFWFYHSVRIALKFVPGLYSGTKAKKAP